MSDTETTTTPTGLSAEDVDAIRAMVRGKDWSTDHAIVADWREDRGYAVTIIETRRMPEGYEPSSISRRHRIPCAGRTERYRRAEGKPRLVASESVYRTEAINAGRALANVVRQGDELAVLFRIGNDTDGLRSVGFTRDECYVTVTRRGKLISYVPVEVRVARDSRYGTMFDWSYTPGDGN